MSELIGRTLGQYRIVQQIGEGGMATVYKAYQPTLNRYVALKVLPPVHAKQPGFQERFQREAQAIADLRHPNILPVYDFGQEAGYSYIAMAYVEGAHSPHQPPPDQLTYPDLEYPYDPKDGREDLDVAGYCVLRGGGFTVGSRHVRSAVRHRNLPEESFETCGFRVVVSTD